MAERGLGRQGDGGITGFKTFIISFAGHIAAEAARRAAIPMSDTTEDNRPDRILSLDGGGAKGFYSLGVLREIEGLVGRPLCECFDLVFGTSTGAIIAALVALGYKVDEIHELYKEHVPTVMRHKTARARSQALADLSNKVFGQTMFDAVKTGIGIVTTKWVIERPMIFKGGVAQAHGRIGTFNRNCPGCLCGFSLRAVPRSGHLGLR